MLLRQRVHGEGRCRSAVNACARFAGLAVFYCKVNASSEKSLARLDLQQNACKMKGHACCCWCCCCCGCRAQHKSKPIHTQPQQTVQLALSCVDQSISLIGDRSATNGSSKHAGLDQRRLFHAPSLDQEMKRRTDTEVCHQVFLPATAFVCSCSLRHALRELLRKLHMSERRWKR